MKLRFAFVTLLAVAFPRGAEGQASGLAAACAAVDETLRATCAVVAQSVQSAQPQVGILVTGGNPTIGAASAGGLRLGLLPRVSATIKANLVYGRIPELREIRTEPTDGQRYGEISFVAPALSGTASVGLFPGLSVAPTIGGIGSVDLLGTASWLPLRAIDHGEFRPGTAEIAYGGGIRIGALRESFTMPGVSLSVMYHRLGTVAFGEICRGSIGASRTNGPGYSLEEGDCVPTDFFEVGGRDMGEFSFDLRSWSSRAVVSKHLLGLGLAAGVGYDHHSSEVGTGFRTPQGPSWEPPNRTVYARVSDVEIDDGRWSAFVDGSFSLLVATVAAEVGWLQGGEATPGYPDSGSDFDPADGTFFGSLGLRVAL